MSTAARDGAIELRAKPHIELLDARVADLDEVELRALARRMTTRAGARHVSRSYSYPLALVAWHDAPIGIDLERIAPCDDAFAALICNADERADLGGVEDLDRHLISLWCAKESLAKALGDARRYEPARLESPTRWPSQRSGAWRCEEVAVDADYVAWMCWRAARD